jgi:IS5 family transposase
MDEPTGAMLQVAVAQANEHDVTLAREQTEPLPIGTICLADAGYQGLMWEEVTLLSPFKKPRNRTLDPLQKAFNRRLAQLRVKVEHRIRTLKIFRMLKGVYRNRHTRFERHLRLMAALVNRIRGY